MIDPSSLRSWGFLMVLAAVSGACATGGSTPDVQQRSGECAFGVCIRAVTASQSIVYTARSDAPIPATVSISFRELRNLRQSGPDTVWSVIPPGESWVLVRLWVENPDARIGARPVVTIDLGSDTLPHEPLRPYRMPFGGEEPRQVIAGYGSPTHLNENHYALDFGMPEGTPVHAAREGVVVHVQDGFTQGGLNPDLIERANMVSVGHADGTIASYGHLEAGIPVQVGDTVALGQLLGWSGSTGFTGEPHLHFHVGKRLVGGPNRTIPVRFDVDGSPEGEELEEGRWYPPQVGEEGIAETSE